MLEIPGLSLSCALFDHNFCSKVRSKILYATISVTIVTKVIACALGEITRFVNDIKAMINIWSDNYTYALRINGILHHLIPTAITNEGLMFFY